MNTVITEKWLLSMVSIWSGTWSATGRRHIGKTSEWCHLRNKLESNKHHMLAIALIIRRCLGLTKQVQRSLVESVSKDIFGRRTSTGSVPFFILQCLDATTFVLLNVFTRIQTISPKIWASSLPKSAKHPLPVEVSGSKTSLLKFSTVNSVLRLPGAYFSRSLRGGGWNNREGTYLTLRNRVLYRYFTRRWYQSIKN